MHFQRTDDNCFIKMTPMLSNPLAAINISAWVLSVLLEIL